MSRRESKHKKAVKARVVLAGNLTSFLNPKTNCFQSVMCESRDTDQVWMSGMRWLLGNGCHVVIVMPTYAFSQA